MHEGIKVYKINKFTDHRGEFYEAYNKIIEDHFEEEFVQTNISKSQAGVFRGLHYQYDDPMGKMITCLDGEIVDFWMDVREGSPTYGEVGHLRLLADEPTLLYLPPGFAHGFYSVTDSIVKYECTSYYNKDGEGAISWKEVEYLKDLDLIVSDKDLSAPSFKEYSSDAKFKFE
jgi:dTDP-4-dehydrorhamnose 3,5-epimerase